ncbi:MAG: hypothetical protein WC979_07860 [Candidatus Pacearchaeota archaeon]|jgi:hypothetical protein
MSGNAISCGCIKPNINFSIGSKFGLWTLIKLDHKIKYGNSTQKVFLCQCECGLEKLVNQSQLLNKLYKASPRCRNCASKNLHNLCKLKGLSVTSKSYGSWRNMISRCYNKNNNAYKYYGGRGIIVCNSWRKSFLNFYNDMGERPLNLTLDRIKSNGNYKLSNCKWSTRREQIINRSMTIHDEFSNLNMSNQRKKQKRWERDKRCTCCGKIRYDTLLCKKCKNKQKQYRHNYYIKNL